MNNDINANIFIQSDDNYMPYAAGVTSTSLYENYGHKLSVKMYEVINYIRVYHCFPVFGKRPLDKGAVYPEKIKWDYYLSISSWYNYMKIESKNIKTTNMQSILYKCLPKKLYAVIYNTMFKYKVRQELKNKNCYK